MLRDLLGANRLPRVRLTHIFRQAQQSGVVTNAHRINAGQHPITHGLADFFLFAEEDRRPGRRRWSWRLWPTACRAALGSILDRRSRCCARCIEGRPAPGR